MDGEMTTSTQTTETAATTSAGTSTGAAGQAAGAETGNQEKASAFKEFLDGLFGAKQEKKEPGAEEKAAEKGTEPPAGKTEEKTFSQAAMEKSLSKLTETFKGSLQAAVEWKNDEACQGGWKTGTVRQSYRRRARPVFKRIPE